MKRQWILASALVCLAFAAKSQFAFSVSPGVGLTGAQFGYQIEDNLVPYISLQYVGGKITVEDTDTENFASASVFIPSIGLKYFAIRENSLKGYFNAALSKPIISGKLEEDGEEDPDFEDAIDNVSSIGFEVGFGVEYYFEENFSIGGEFGLRNMSFKYEDSDADDDYTVKAHLSPTYTKLTVNYYFGRNKE